MSETTDPTAVKRVATRSRLKGAEFARLHHHYTVTAGTPIEAVMDPGYFVPVHSFLKPLDRLEVVEERGAWIAEFVVRRSSADGVELTGLFGKELEGGVGMIGALSPLAADLRVSFEGSHRRWVAWRGTEVLREGFASEAETWTWLRSYHDTVKRTPKAGAAA